MEEKEKTFSTYPQQEEKKAESSSAKGREKKLVATKTCNVELPGCDCIVELVEGQPVIGLTRQEREHLLVHGFVK